MRSVLPAAWSSRTVARPRLRSPVRGPPGGQHNIVLSRGGHRGHRSPSREFLPVRGGHSSGRGQPASPATVMHNNGCFARPGLPAGRRITPGRRPSLGRRVTNGSTVSTQQPDGRIARLPACATPAEPLLGEQPRTPAAAAKKRRASPTDRRRFVATPRFTDAATRRNRPTGRRPGQQVEVLGGEQDAVADDDELDRCGEGASRRCPGPEGPAVTRPGSRHRSRPATGGRLRCTCARRRALSAAAARSSALRTQVSSSGRARMLLVTWTTPACAAVSSPGK